MNLKSSQIDHIILDNKGIYCVVYSTGVSYVYSTELPETVSAFLAEHPFLFYRLNGYLSLCTRKLGAEWRSAEGVN